MVRLYKIIGVVLALAVVSPADAAIAVINLDGLDNNAPIDVEIDTACKNGNPVFRIINQGKDWPRRASVEIDRIGDGQAIVKRNMRMKAGQHASFRLPVKKIGQGEFGLRLRPSWYDRNGDFDVRIACN